MTPTCLIGLRMMIPLGLDGCVDVVEPAVHVGCAYEVAAFAVRLGVELGAAQMSAELYDAFLPLDCFGLAVGNEGLQLLDVVHKGVSNKNAA